MTFAGQSLTKVERSAKSANVEKTGDSRVMLG